MKFILISIILYLVFSMQMFSQENNKAKGDIMFEDNMHNFKKIKYDSESYFDFDFKNIGKAPLTITKIETSCGCTIAEKPEAPIAKKGKGFIRVWYDSKRVGKFSKTITVYSDGKNSPTKLMIKGEVLPKKNKIDNK